MAMELREVVDASLRAWADVLNPLGSPGVEIFRRKKSRDPDLARRAQSTQCSISMALQNTIDRHRIGHHGENGLERYTGAFPENRAASIAARRRSRSSWKVSARDSSSSSWVTRSVRPWRRSWRSRCGAATPPRARSASRRRARSSTPFEQPRRPFVVTETSGDLIKAPSLFLLLQILTKGYIYA